MALKRFWKTIIIYYYRFFKTPEDYAKFIGVKIGEHCLIDTRYWSTEPYLISIGNYVQVTSDVRFQTHGGGNVLRENYPNFDAFGKIVIEDRAYIGAASQIMPGVTIGKGALVAAGSIVTKSVPSAVVVGGNPAKIICTIEEYKQRALAYNLETKQMQQKEKKKFLLNTPENKFIKKKYLK